MSLATSVNPIAAAFGHRQAAVPMTIPTTHSLSTHEPPSDRPLLSGLASAPFDNARALFRCIQCSICSHPLNSPVTLPCGTSVCKTCIPPAHERKNITYPNLASRRQVFKCPVLPCRHEHNAADCAKDVVLDKIMSDIRQLMSTCNALPPANHMDDSTTDTINVRPETTADGPVEIASTRGRFVDCYNLATRGLLQCDQDIVYNGQALPVRISQSAQLRVCETGGACAPDVDLTILTSILDAVSKETDCQVCYNMFLDPVTTACGHTFCRNCLEHSLDHSRHCPVCRRTLYMVPSLPDSSHPTNRQLQTLLLSLCPDAVQARAELFAMNDTSRYSAKEIPLFIVSNAFPHCPTFLRIFEPRYRLMLRRALAGNRQFGMVAYNNEGTSQGSLGNVPFKQYGTLLHIEHAQIMPDGTSLVETRGLSTFMINGYRTQDGYTIADVEMNEDISLAQEELDEVFQTEHPASIDAPLSARIHCMPTQALLQIGHDFIHRMRARSADWLMNQMAVIHGEPPDDAAVFPYWLASILPIRESAKYELLQTTSVRQRLQIVVRWIAALDAHASASAQSSPGGGPQS